MKVNAEVGVKADIRDGDVGARLPAQSAVLPVAVPDAWETGKREDETTNLRHIYIWVVPFAMTTKQLTAK